MYHIVSDLVKDKEVGLLPTSFDNTLLECFLNYPEIKATFPLNFDTLRQYQEESETSNKNQRKIRSVLN